jgi:hypothetical protein
MHQQLAALIVGGGHGIHPVHQIDQVGLLGQLGRDVRLRQQFSHCVW